MSDEPRSKQRITAQVLNGATGEVREVVAAVTASNVQEAVNKMFAAARQDDFYYRFLCKDGVISPTSPNKVEIVRNNQTYWAREGD